MIELTQVTFVKLNAVNCESSIIILIVNADFLATVAESTKSTLGVGLQTIEIKSFARCKNLRNKVQCTVSD